MSKGSRDYQEFLEALGFSPSPFVDSLHGTQVTPAPLVGPATTSVTPSAPTSATKVPAPDSNSQPLATWPHDIQKQAATCNNCTLCETRTHVVFGKGASHTPLMFVGEAPGIEEDAQGVPFVGKSGELLTRMIEAMGFHRDSVYITHVVKCLPPNSRNPAPEEIASCLGYLKTQIENVKPRVIVALGTFAAQTLLSSQDSITKLRGRFHTLELARTDKTKARQSEHSKEHFVEEQVNQAVHPHDNRFTVVMPTLHPAFLLRNPEMKKTVWEDLKLVMAHLNASA